MSRIISVDLKKKLMARKIWDTCRFIVAHYCYFLRVTLGILRSQGHDIFAFCLEFSRDSRSPTPYKPGGGGGTLIFSHIRRLGPFFGFKILNFNIFWGFQKNEYFLGVLRFVNIFGGSSQNWASLRVISMLFRVFFKVKVQNWDIFLGC